MGSVLGALDVRLSGAGAGRTGVLLESDRLKKPNRDCWPGKGGGGTFLPMADDFGASGRWW
jgi:hypothetical protein